MDLRRCQIWAHTGKHIIQADYVKTKCVRTESGPSDADQSVESSVSNDVSGGSSSSSSIPDELFGADDDPLIPKSADIDRIFHQGRETWKQFVKSAEALPPNSFPPGLMEPSIMLKDVPALPEKIPTKALIGQPVWHIPSPEQEQEEHPRNENNSLEYVCGIQKEYYFSYPNPIECRFSSLPGSSHFGSTLHSDSCPSATSRSLSILTLLWSYILSVRLLELQGEKIQYSQYSLQPKAAKTCNAQQDDIILNLQAASHELVRWLCAILAPKPGWLAASGRFPPWAAFCSGDARFIISTNQPIALALNEQPPSSAQAMELLIEFCSLYGLGPDNGGDQMSKPLSPPTAAFLAALALPFYRHVNLQPQFSIPKLRRRRIDIATLQPIRQYVSDLRYYMTLSMHPRSLGSVLWSIFWQPDIECNVVSPWLSSILSVIKPIIDSRNPETLAKVFVLRRPRVALWWLGIFLLGNPTILDWIARYLETLEERWGFASMAPPDIAVAAWTGSPQSFLDEESLCVYPETTDMVLKSDLLRHRYNFRLQDSTSIPLSWRPFGDVAKAAIEPYLWPWLEQGHIREYVHWIWWIKKGKRLIRDVQLGFRQETDRFIEDVPDRLELMSVGRPTRYGDVTKLAPSRQSTLRMMHYYLSDANGDTDRDITTMPGVKTHPWLKYWRGLE